MPKSTTPSRRAAPTGSRTPDAAAVVVRKTESHRVAGILRLKAGSPIMERYWGMVQARLEAEIAHLKEKHGA